MQKVGKHIGWDIKKGEGHTAGLLRSLVLGQLVSFNDKATIAKAVSIYKKSKNLPADLRAVIYRAAAVSGNAKQHDQFIKQYNSETLSEEKNRIGRALTQFSDPKLLINTLQFSLSKDVRIQDTPQIFGAVWANTAGKKLVWEFTKKNWKILQKNYPSSGHMLNRFIKPAASFVSGKEAEDIKKFFKVHKAPEAKRAIEQTLEKIYSNEAWMKRDQKKVSLWLSKMFKIFKFYSNLKYGTIRKT